MQGKLNALAEKYKDQIKEKLIPLVNISMTYTTKDFSCNDLIKVCSDAVTMADLIIVDHAHFFDYGEDTENGALKNIAKTVRGITQVTKKPILLVAHLRKADKFSKEIAPSIEEFHGSSDLTKIATKVITLGRGKPSEANPNLRATFVRVPKNRYDGSITWYVAKVYFDFITNNYVDSFTFGCLKNNGKEFEVSKTEDMPQWMKTYRMKNTIKRP